MEGIKTKQDALNYFRKWQIDHGITPMKKMNENITRSDLPLNITFVRAYSVEDLERGWNDQPLIDYAIELATPKKERVIPASEKHFRDRLAIAKDGDSSYKRWLVDFYHNKIDNSITASGYVTYWKVLEASMQLIEVHIEMEKTPVKFYICYRHPLDYFDTVVAKFCHEDFVAHHVNFRYLKTNGNLFIVD